MKSFLTFSFIFSSLFSFCGTAKIEADKLSGCSPLQVIFSGNSEAKDAVYNWDFGNGSKSERKSSSVVFIEPGVYKVKLLVKNNSTVEESTVDISVFATPQPDFTADKTKACADDVISFGTKTSSSNNIVNYVWGFGDDKTITGPNAFSTNHVYKNAGQFDVSLLVTDSHGCMGSKIAYSMVESSPKPVAAFKPSVASSCSETQQISFSNQSTGGNKLDYTWSFGDKKTSAEMNPSHSFSQGKYDVALSVKDENGCLSTVVQKVSITKLKVDFIAEKDMACTGEKLKFVNTSNYKGNKWAWDFGDGTTSAENNPEKAFLKAGNYSVKLTITDGECTQTVSKNAYVNVRNGINTSFTSDISNSCNQPVSVKLKNNTPNSAVVLWNFGDGTVSTKSETEKVYAQAGTYNVSLEVTDSSGCTVKKEADKAIHALKPMVRFIADTFACAGYQIKFTNFTPNAASYLWSFGDGETSTQKNPFHIYKKDGHYDISLTAFGDGCDSTITMKEYVNVSPLKVDFEIASVQSFVPPFLCTFVNKTNNPSLKYMWDFGDGNTEKASASTAAHIYNTPGNFNIRLIGYSKSGCTNSKTIPYNFQVGTSSIGE